MTDIEIYPSYTALHVPQPGLESRDSLTTRRSQIADSARTHHSAIQVTTIVISTEPKHYIETPHLQYLPEQLISTTSLKAGIIIISPR